MEEVQRVVGSQLGVAVKMAMGLSYAWFVLKDPEEQHHSRLVASPGSYALHHVRSCLET